MTDEESQRFWILVCNLFTAKHYQSRGENLDRFQYRLQPIKLVNSAVPSPCETQPYIKGLYFSLLPSWGQKCLAWGYASLRARPNPSISLSNLNTQKTCCATIRNTVKSNQILPDYEYKLWRILAGQRLTQRGGRRDDYREQIQIWAVGRRIWTRDFQISNPAPQTTRLHRLY